MLILLILLFLITPCMAENYLEIKEQLTETEQIEKQPLVIKREVANMKEAIAIYSNDEVSFTGKSYKVQYHQHHHDINGKGNNWPCSVEIIKEIKEITEIKEIIK